MKVTITKTKLNSIIKKEYDGLILESIQKKDYRTLRELYLLETGAKTIDEGKFTDWVKGKAQSVKTAVTGAAKKVSNVFAGIKDIGLGSGTTILGGEETLDIEKRKEKLGAAKAKVEGWLSKLPAQNPLVGEIKELYATLDKGGFPNPKDRGGFDGQVKQVQDVYNKVVEAFNGSSKSEEDAKASNVLIAVLRGIVIYFQDYKIADKYIYLKEAEEPTAEMPAAEEPIGSAEGEGSKSAAAAYSKKLPAGLAIAGVSMITLGIGADSKKFQNILMSMKDMSKATPDEISQRIVREQLADVDVSKGDGITQALNAMSSKTPADPGFLGPNTPIKELRYYKNQLTALKQALIDPRGGAIIDKIINGEIPGNTKLGEFFKGTVSGKGGSLLAIKPGNFKLIVQKEVRKVVQGVAAQPLDTVKNKAIGAFSKLAGPVLKGLGLAFLGGAAVSAGMRMKGSQSSRMNDLRKLVTAMPDVKPGGGTQAVPAPATPETQPQGGEQGGEEPTAKLPQGGEGGAGGEEPTVKIPQAQGGKAGVSPDEAPTIVDPSMQPTVVDPSKQQSPSGVEPTVKMPNQPVGVEPTVKMGNTPEGEPEEVEGGEDVTPPEGPDELAYAAIVKNQEGGELEKKINVKQAETILRAMGVPQANIDAHLSPAEDNQGKKPAEMYAQSKIQKGMKESLIRSKKLYSLKETIEFGKTYKEMQRMKKLAGLLRD